MSNLDPLQLLTAVLVIVFAHIAGWVASFRLNIVYLVASAFVFVAPLSAAINLPALEAIKWLRLYLTVMMVIVAFVHAHRIPLPGRVGTALFIGFSLFIISPLWGSATVQGLLYRMIFVTTLYAGMLMGLSTTTSKETGAAVRLLLLPAAAFGLMMLMVFARDPSSISGVGRLSAFGMNANRIGQTAAPLLILCAYVALHDRVKIFKIIAYAIAAFLAMVVVLTGSRGAVGQSVIGCFIVALPLIRHPVRAAFVLMVLAVTVYWLSGIIQPSRATERLSEFNFESRDEPWSQAADFIATSPVIGHGWVFETGLREGGSEINLHSMYLQILADSGFVGLLVFAVAIFYCAWKSLVTLIHLQTSWTRDMDPTIYLALAAVLSSLAWGFIDSGPVMGSTVNCLMLGYGAALVDRAELFIAQRQWTADQASRWGYGGVAVT